MKELNFSLDPMENLIDKVKKILLQNPEIHNFTLIGDKTIEVDNSEFNFEIYCRYIDSKYQDDDDELEFLVNDVTRTRLIEKHHVEMKYKTLFLSKIAHEFKNPLICIVELINQLHENIIKTSKNKMIQSDCDNLNNSMITKSLTQIKSMSNFLLVLVKDLNYFSEIHIGKNVKFEKNDVNLRELLEFSRDITESLLKKTSKQGGVTVSFYKSEDLPEIVVTDEWRLKQVIVNLLSNAVKFTYFGEISFKISYTKIEDKPFVEFRVTDTGAGIKDEQIASLFEPLSRGQFKNNELGSGLGLSIVKEIVLKLGGKINVSSQFGQGTCFWFDIPFEPANENLNIIEEISESNLNNSLQSFDQSKNELIETRLFNMNFSLDRRNSIVKKVFHCHNFSEATKSIKYGEIENFVNVNEEQSDHNVLSKNKTLRPSSQIIIKEEDQPKPFEYSHLKNCINIIVTDDEIFTRQSSVRVLKSIASEMNININIIEAQDGVETIFIFYKCISQGVRIAMIVSDENMNFMNGTKTYDVLSEILEKKNLNKINFNLLTALDNNAFDIKYRSQEDFNIVSKPLTRDMARTILSERLKF
jgi:signal transduction histidine kinase